MTHFSMIHNNNRSWQFIAILWPFSITQWTKYIGGQQLSFGRWTVTSQIKALSSFWASRIMGSTYANEQDGLKVSWACLFTGLEMRKNMGQVKKTLKWARKKSCKISPVFKMSPFSKMGQNWIWGNKFGRVQILSKLKWDRNTPFKISTLCGGMFEVPSLYMSQVYEWHILGSVLS